MATPALVVEKVRSFDAGDFNETTEFTVLHCANVDGNNNKFYIIEIQKNPTTGLYRLFTNYGRLGVEGVYEIRQKDKAGNTLDEARCKIECAKIVKKKERGKTVKRNGETIKEHYSVVDVVSPNIGSSNIRNAASVNVSTSANAPMVNTSNHDSESARLIRTFVSANIHSITGSTSLTFTRNGFETPLGPVTEPHIDKAQAFLDDMRDELGDGDSLNAEDKGIRVLNSEYFSLIPRKFGRVIQRSDMILTPDELAAEYDLLDQLRTAVKTGLNADSEDADTGLDLAIALLSKSDPDWDRFDTYYEGSKHSSHYDSGGYHIRRIFTLDIPSVTSRYNPTLKKLGNERELFHGTKTANMLSIAVNGLIIPPTGAAHVTGRMFGNGVYAASCSTKALNYATGFWGGNSNKTPAAYMMIVRFAMGKEYKTKSFRYAGAPSGYDSVWGQSSGRSGGGGLLNDEYIVYSLNQATITHILELEK